MYSIKKLQIKIARPIFGMFPKRIPVTYIGIGKVMEVANILKMYGIKSVLIVTGKILNASGLLKPMLKSIEEGGIQAVVYAGVTQDPTYTVVQEGLDVCKQNRCEAIIAFGGGSVIDCAKVISVSYTNNKSPRQFEGTLKVKKAGLPFICIPTTAGTGSEATLVAVISDSKTHHKTTIVDPRIIPDVAILDAELTKGLPLSITATTVLDALTHAIESYISNYATKKTRKYAEIAIKLIYENIDKVWENPQDLSAREALLVASFYAGMAFTRALIGYVHAFAHSIGGKFGVPHGLANAVILPHIMEFSKQSSEKEFARLADLVGISNGNDSESKKADCFIESIRLLNKRLHIPEKIEKFPKSAIDEVCEEAFKECHGTYPVPRYLTKQEAKEILEKIAN